MADTASVITIKPRDFYKHYFQLAPGQSTLRWAFKSTKRSISFGLFYLVDDDAKSRGCDLVGALNRARITIDSFALASRAIPEQQQLVPGEMLELMPIQRYAAADERVIAGSVEEAVPGTYVLYFDNTFSVQTPKQVQFVIGDRAADRGASIFADARDSVSVVWSGWLLKKKRRRLPPGWSQRWFLLDSRGHLSYYEEQPRDDDPQQHPRGIISLGSSCTISKVPSRRLITIDSGVDIFHLRAMTDADYAQWSDRLTVAIMGVPVPLADLQHIQERLQSVRLYLQQQHSASVVDELLACTESLMRITGRHHRRSSIAHIPTEAPAAAAEQAEEAEEDFYDVEEIILSDISDSEYEDAAAHAEGEATPMSESVTPISESVAPVAETMAPVAETMAPLAETATPASPLVCAPPAAAAFPVPGQRTSLPFVPPACPDVSLAAILRKSIGKDWSAMSMPVTLNEPLNVLQRMAEELEYAHLLDQAASIPDSDAERQREEALAERLLLVAAFAVSGYAAAGRRVERKPFNPMLGETYELETEGFRFLGEKVSHRPLVFACHAADRSAAPDARWEYRQHQGFKSKFWGKSIEYLPTGATGVSLTQQREAFSWTKVTSCVRNILSMNKWVEFYGETKVHVHPAEGDCWKHGWHAKITFKTNSSSSFFSSSTSLDRLEDPGRNLVSIEVFDGKRLLRAQARGRWDDSLVNGGSGAVIWRASVPEEACAVYYGFSYLSLLLNELPAEESAASNLPRTDTRWRPDQRLLEEGNLAEAESEKARIEQQQRDARAAMEAAGESWRPRWFVPRIEPFSGEAEWAFGGQYWRAKEASEWPADLPHLW